MQTIKQTTAHDTLEAKSGSFGTATGAATHEVDQSESKKKHRSMHQVRFGVEQWSQQQEMSVYAALARDAVHTSANRQQSPIRISTPKEEPTSRGMKPEKVFQQCQQPTRYMPSSYQNQMASSNTNTGNRTQQRFGQYRSSKSSRHIGGWQFAEQGRDSLSREFKSFAGQHGIPLVERSKEEQYAALIQGGQPLSQSESTQAIRVPEGAKSGTPSSPQRAPALSTSQNFARSRPEVQNSADNLQRMPSRSGGSQIRVSSFIRANQPTKRGKSAVQAYRTTDGYAQRTMLRNFGQNQQANQTQNRLRTALALHRQRKQQFKEHLQQKESAAENHLDHFSLQNPTELFHLQSVKN